MFFQFNSKILVHYVQPVVRMSAVFEIWKEADAKTKVIVTGYIKSIQNACGLDNIPDVIAYV